MKRQELIRHLESHGCYLLRDRGIIQPSRDAVRELDLAELILQHVGARALQNPERAALKTRRMPACLNAFAAGFHTNHLHWLILEKRIKQSHRIRAAADTGDQHVRQPLLFFQDLPPRFIPDHALEIPHHQRIGMWPERTA